MTRLLRIGIAALAVPATTLALLQAPAPAATNTLPGKVVVRLSSHAHLSADRKTATLKVTITCKNATPAPITGTITQNRGSLTVHGHGQSSAGYKCNGVSHAGVIPVKAAPGEHFQAGGASATVNVSLMGNDGNPATDSDTRDIVLK
jgi:hypothetical protein